MSEYRKNKFQCMATQIVKISSFQVRNTVKSATFEMVDVFRDYE